VFDSETATVSVRVNTGSVNDTKSGTNAFLSRLSQKKIASQLSGVKLNTQACREHTVYSARVLKGDAASVLAVIADGVANPPLDAQTVEAERANLVNEAGAASKRYQERLYYHLYQTAFMDSGEFLSLFFLTSSSSVLQVWVNSPKEQLMDLNQLV
jgi:predicted Zn-dependent peptidase